MGRGGALVSPIRLAPLSRLQHQLETVPENGQVVPLSWAKGIGACAGIWSSSASASFAAKAGAAGAVGVVGFEKGETLEQCKN